jgi:hypothetical protein
MDQTLTQDSPQQKEYNLKEVFPKFKDFPFDFRLTKQPRV